jgi:DNA uptake protein ComE-like DNA-binding protein
MNKTVESRIVRTSGTGSRQDSVDRTRPFDAPRAKRGSVLLIVLVIVAVLALAASHYTQSMLTEFEATTMYGSDVQAREAADSGVEYIATMLGNRADPALENLQHNPSLFMGKMVIEAPRARGTARFTVIAPVENSTVGNAIRYGLMDESAKLNLNLLLSMKLEDDQMQAMLMNIPGMTIEAADSILDWIDTDDTKRPYGAESETYEGMSPPYRAKNGPLESLDELLMVQGVTPALLYGEDANRNGLLDPNEDDGEASPPLDNRDGILDHGWSAFLTAYGRESSLRADGRPKINLNNGLLTDLYDALEDEFGEATAKFVIAMRMNGPKETETSPNGGSSGKGSGSDSDGGGGGGSRGNRRGGGGGGTRNQGGGLNTGSTDQAAQQQQQNTIQGLGKALASAALSPGGKVTRGGIDISTGGPVQIKSIWELFGSTATADVNGNSEDQKSPWAADPNQLQAVLPSLLDALSTTDDEFIHGRININQARREVLMGIPGMDDELLEKIIAAQRLDANGQPSPEVIQNHSTIGWLYFEGLVDLQTMIELEPYLTTRGDVYKAQVFGFHEGGGPITRLEVMIDATQNPPRVLFQRDLNDLGHGYSRSQLFPVAR